MSYSAKSDRVLIINGPNLNLLGKREPEIYGTDTMDDILHRIRSTYSQLTIEYFQSNHEGAIIDELHRAGYGDNAYRGIVLNAGAYTHTSLAIADAISAIPVPVIEVHISNVHSREAVRHTSMISSVCRGVIAGFGADSYRLAVDALSK
jgi:3-dehydroquinate dehydratase-2